MQVLATDIIYYYPTIAPATLSTVAATCLCMEVPEAIVMRLVSVVSARMSSLTPAAFLSFLATLLTGRSSLVAHDPLVDRRADESSGPSAGRHATVVAAACQALRAIGDAGAHACKLVDPCAEVLQVDWMWAAPTCLLSGPRVNGSCPTEQCILR